MEARRVGVLILLASVGLGAFLQEASIPPESLATWLCCEGPGSMLLAARGPAVMAYDAERDVTFAVFACGHGHCDAAATIQGDARALADARSLLLFTPYPSPTRKTTTMDEPMRVPDGPRGETDVTQATTITFEVASYFEVLFPRALAFTLFAVGAALAWGVPRWVTPVTVAASVAGLAGGFTLASGGSAIAMLSVIAIAIASAAAVVAALVAWRDPRARGAPWPVAAFAAALAFAAFTWEPIFAHGPML